MAKNQVEFGYYPRQCDFRAGDISLVALPDLTQKVADVENCDTVHDGWIYAPRLQQNNFKSKNGEETVLPFGSRVFGLPRTHVLVHENPNNHDHLDFLVWCIGFFAGMRLTTTEAGFLDATPIKPNKLTDFILSTCTLADAIDVSEKYWRKNHCDSATIKRVTGAMHALFISQHPKHLQFEEFVYLYIAIDACFSIMEAMFKPRPRTPHGSRIDWMCKQFGMPTPDWAMPGHNGSEISQIRNNSIHEGLFFNEPLGFSIYGGNAHLAQQRPNVPLQMSALTCRLLVAILGKPDCDYVKSPVNTRQIHSLVLT